MGTELGGQNGYENLASGDDRMDAYHFHRDLNIMGVLFSFSMGH